MKISIRQPLSFSEIGLKDNQEDALYPNPVNVTLKQRVFLLCDGMGGHEHGEVASNTVTETMGEVLDASADPRADFNMALAEAYSALDAKDTDDAERKMGTTLTCLILDEKGAFVAHIGDSRVYQVRPTSGLVLQTSDHSLVNDLLKAGELTEEEAVNYPQKNIITRAMQPNQGKRSKAEIDLQDDVQSGDYFFLCCDGVLEKLTNQRLCEILSMPISDKDKLSLIKAECDGKTKDNYTCWLVPIDKVVNEESDKITSGDDVILAVAEENPSTSELEVSCEKCTSKKKGVFWSALILAFLVIIAGLLLSYYYFFQSNDSCREELKTFFEYFGSYDKCDTDTIVVQ